MIRYLESDLPRGHGSRQPESKNENALAITCNLRPSTDVEWFVGVLRMIAVSLELNKLHAVFAWMDLCDPYAMLTVDSLGPVASGRSADGNVYCGIHTQKG